MKRLALAASGRQADVSSPQPGQSAARSPFRSFWMAGFEGADHVNRRAQALDMARATGHLLLLDEDYRQVAARGLRTIRETIGWRVSEPQPGCFDLSRARRCATAARSHGLQVVWTLMHYGTPSDVSMFDDRMIARFAAFARAVALALRPLSHEPPIYNLVNEINFTSWAASETLIFGGPQGPRPAAGMDTKALGYDVKRRLVRAALAAMAAVREVDPRARFLHIEPLVHVVAPGGEPELEPVAAALCEYQWQAFDLLAGRAEPELGGSPGALDLIGLNYYHSNQWEAGTEERLFWHKRDPRRRALSSMLAQAWERYRRPLVIAETSHVGAGRAAWLNDTMSEVVRARAAGVPVEGVCLYPIVDRPDWDDADHWHNSGLWDVVPGSGQRVLNTCYANALARWQSAIPLSSPGSRMRHLIVFSHLRWSFVYQRPQHLLTRLSRHYHVVFVEEPVHCEGPAHLECASQGPNLDVLVPRTPVAACGFHDRQLPVLEPLIADYLREHGIDDYVVWFYTPMALPLMGALAPRAVVYDCMDELAAFKHAPRQLRQRESVLLKLADVVFTGGPALYESKRDRHPNVHCLPSAVDAGHFDPACLDPECAEAREAARLHAAVGHPRLGFFGVIDERLDLALLTQVADARRDLQLVLVGPVVKIDEASLPRRPNIHWLGMQSYARLPHLVAQWDVCLIPFALNESTRYISPTKTLEYLAAGKPVVSTPVHDVVALYGELVRVAGNAVDFIDACDDALIETGRERSRRVDKTSRAVAACSWDHTADAMHRLVEQVLLEGDGSADARRRPAARTSPEGGRSSGVVAPLRADLPGPTTATEAPGGSGDFAASVADGTQTAARSGATAHPGIEGIEGADLVARPVRSPAAPDAGQRPAALRPGPMEKDGRMVAHASPNIE